jgi:hypothetical protein
MGRPVHGADPKTFEVLLGSYARDAHNVFFHIHRSQRIDRTTFRVLNLNFGVDDTHAFFAVTPIKGAHSDSFRVLDSSLVHCGSSGAAGTFLSAGYAADSQSVWFCSGSGIFRIKSADPHTFVSLGNGYGHDRERVYFEHSMLPKADRTTWRLWRHWLSVDKNSVFFTNKRVANVDRTSIALLEAENCFIDRHQIYRGCEVITPEEYLAKLHYCKQAYDRERKSIQKGKIFDKLLNEWPHEA